MLNKRAGLPHRATCIKIMRVIRTLVEIKLKRAITVHATARMPVMNAENTDKSLEVVKLEEAKYASICVSVYSN